jgi:hypothetical protein
MIAAPLNDHACLGHITDTVRNLVQQPDPAWLALAEETGATEKLAARLRRLPQRDDNGDPTDGPREDACTPSQRVRLSPLPPDPNCVERAAIYVGVAELIDPRPVRQLRTVMTAAGLHTYPVENRSAVWLDPTVPRNALRADVLQSLPLGAVFTLHEAVGWLLEIATEPASQVVGGLARVHAASQAIGDLLAGAYLDDRAIDDIAYTCALALREARAFGAAGLALVRETVRALGARLPRYAAPIVGPATPGLELEANRRNAVALKIGGRTITPNWDLLGRLGRVGLNVGTDVGVAALKVKLASMGLSPTVLSVVEHELNREGVTLGRLAPQAPSLAALALLPRLGQQGSTASTAATMAAASAIAAPAAAREVRNAWVATPGLILSEMNLTNQDILALGRDIRASFRRPFEEQLAAARDRFAREYGRIPGVGIAGKGPGDYGIGASVERDADGRHKRVTLTAANAFSSTEEDDAKVHAWMSPVPTAADLQWKSYQGNFVHQWGEFEREWGGWYAEHTSWTSRFWGAALDTPLDYRARVKKWREQFLQLGGTANAPTPLMPTQPGLGDWFSGKRLVTAALVAGGVVGAAILLPPLLRRT